MNESLEALKDLRANVHRQASEKNAQGLTEAAQALWGVVEALDLLLIRLNTRRH